MALDENTRAYLAEEAYRASTEYLTRNRLPLAMNIERPEAKATYRTILDNIEALDLRQFIPEGEFKNNVSDLRLRQLVAEMFQGIMLAEKQARLAEEEALRQAYGIGDPPPVGGGEV